MPTRTRPVPRFNLRNLLSLLFLVAPVVTEPGLEVEYGPGPGLAQVCGYEPRRTEGGLKIKLDNMNQGLTQVVMLRFRVRPRAREAADARPAARVNFGGHHDLEQKRRVTKTRASRAPSASRRGTGSL